MPPDPDPPGDTASTLRTAPDATPEQRAARGRAARRGESFDRALTGFGEKYADRNELDHRALVDAVRAGRLPADRDV